jgi:hypothetical protein
MKGQSCVNHNSRQRTAIGGTAVDIDAVSIMRWAVNCGVTMDDQSTVIACVFEKVFADPQQIIFGLMVKCDARTDACVHEKAVTALVCDGQILQEIPMRLGHGGDGFNMNGH